MVSIKKIIIGDVQTLKKEAKIEEAAKLLAKTQNGCIVIVENQLPIGIVTELDFVRNLTSDGANLKESVNKIMSSPATSMSLNTKLDEALKIVDTKKFRKYPVIENGKLIGIVTKNDIVHEMSDNVRLHRTIQNIVLILFVLFEFFVFVIHEYLYPYFPLSPK